MARIALLLATTALLAGCMSQLPAADENARVLVRVTPSGDGMSWEGTTAWVEVDSELGTVLELTGAKSGQTHNVDVALWSMNADPVGAVNPVAFHIEANPGNDAVLDGWGGPGTILTSENDPEIRFPVLFVGTQEQPDGSRLHHFLYQVNDGDRSAIGEHGVDFVIYNATGETYQLRLDMPVGQPFTLTAADANAVLLPGLHWVLAADGDTYISLYVGPHPVPTQIDLIDGSLQVDVLRVDAAPLEAPTDGEYGRRA